MRVLDRRALAPGEAWEGRRDVGNNSKPFGGAQWALSPPGRVWPTAGSESCVLVGRPPGRSVDSVCTEPAHSAPKLVSSWEPLPCAQAGAAPALPYWPGRAVPPGSLEVGAATLGFPRNLGGLSVPAVLSAVSGQPILNGP